MLINFNKAYSTYLISSIVSGGANLLSVLFFIDFFGQATYGVFILIFTSINLISLFISSPLNQILLRFLPEFKNNELVISLFYNNILFSLIGSVVCYVIIWLNFNNYGYAIMAGISLININIYQFYQAYLQSKQRVDKYLYMEITRSLVFLFLPFLLCIFFNQRNIYNLFFSLNISFLLNITIVLFGNRKNTNISIIMNLSAYMKHVYLRKDILEYMWPLVLWFVFAQLLNLSDRYLIAKYFDIEDVGYYSAVYDIFYKGATLLLAPITIIYYSELIRSHNNNDIISINKILWKGIRYQILITFVLIVCIYILDKSVNVDYMPSIIKHKDFFYLSTCIVLGAFFWQNAILLQKKLELLKKTKLMLVCCIIAFLVNFFLNYFTLQEKKLLYAAINTAIGSVVYLSLIYLFSWKY